MVSLVILTYDDYFLCPNIHYIKRLVKLFSFCLSIALVCSFYILSDRNFVELFYLDTPLIVVVTPTYDRPSRIADLVRFVSLEGNKLHRMGNTLAHIKDLHWIVVEDAYATDPIVTRLLKRTGLPFTYIEAETRSGYPKKGWYQRNVALRYIREHKHELLANHRGGVLFLGDDDNTYDADLFQNYIRNVKKLGMWAVGTADYYMRLKRRVAGLVGGAEFEVPYIRNDTVQGFLVRFSPGRKFAVDMAGFAINLKEIFNSTIEFGKDCKGAKDCPETCFLEDLKFEWSDIEPFECWDPQKPMNMEGILVWHTKTNYIMFNTSRWATPVKFTLPELFTTIC